MAPASNLTETQTRYLALAWLCFDAEPKIDYDRFAQLAGLKSAASAREMLRVTKKKLLDYAPATDGSGPSAPPNTPASKSTRKKAAPKTKSTKSTKSKGGKKRQASSDEDDSDEDESPLKKKMSVKIESVEEDSSAGAGVGSEDDDEV